MSEPATTPQAGETWEAIDACETQIQYLFRAPITFSGTAKLAAGERVSIVGMVANSQPIVVQFVPVRYAELHDLLVPADIRDTPRYQKYLLSAPTGYFTEHFRLIRDGA